MLIKLNGTNETKRVQCPWVSEEEVQKVCDYLRAQGEPVYDENILRPREDEDGGGKEEDDAETDVMYDAAVRLVTDTHRCSTSTPTGRSAESDLLILPTHSRGGCRTYRPAGPPDAPRACAFAAHGRRNPFPADRCHLRIGTIRCRLIERGS